MRARVIACVQAQQQADRDKQVKQQLAQHQQRLGAQEDSLRQQRAQVQGEQEALDKRTAALKKKEQELVCTLERIGIGVTGGAVELWL